MSALLLREVVSAAGTVVGLKLCKAKTNNLDMWEMETCCRIRQHEPLRGAKSHKFSSVISLCVSPSVFSVPQEIQAFTSQVSSGSVLFVYTLLQ